MWTSAKSRRTPARRLIQFWLVLTTQQAAPRGGTCKASLTAILYPALLQQTKPKGAQAANTLRATWRCLWLGVCLQLRNGEWRQVLLSGSRCHRASSLEIFSDVVTRDKERKGLCYSREIQVCLSFLVSPPPCPHKGLQVTIAHIQRDLHLWEKNYLHLFRFIYIHSWILIQKEKN